jgi:hypothetical protein
MGRRKVVLTLSFLGMLYANASAVADDPQKYAPSLLGDFLRKTPSVSVEKALGTLTGPDSTVAVFTAIVASDPATSNKVKGLEVKLSDAQHRDTVYWDDDEDGRGADSLKMFQESLVHIGEEPRAPEVRPGEPLPHQGYFAVVRNRPPGTEEWCCPRVGVLQAGLWRDGSRFRLEMATLQHPRWYVFSDGSVDNLIQILEAGRAFLAAH